MISPKFIVFEGIDGAGKTTQIKLLASRLEEMNIPCALTAEPTALPSGKKLREALSGRLAATPYEMAQMFAVDRVAHNVEKGGISELLGEGKTVISDRYYYSSLAYQGTELGFDTVAELNLGKADIRRPDLCIFLDLTPERSLERIRARADVPTEIYENREYLERTRTTFFSVFEKLRAMGENIAVIDAYGSVDEVAGRVAEAALTIFDGGNI